MAKKRKRQGAPTPRKLDSDEEADRMADPNPDARSFMLDEIDEFHENKEKILLQTAKKYASRHVESEDEEVFDLDLSSSEDNENDALRQFKINVQKDEMESDLEDDEDDEDRVPDDKAWGSYKPAYYNTDYVDKGQRVKSHDEDQLALSEEQEAKALQQRLTEQTDDQAYDVDLYMVAKKAPESKATKNKEAVVAKDIATLSKLEKIEIIKRESPDLLVLLEDLKNLIAETKNRLLPLISLVERGVIADGPAATYLKTKYQVMINYFTNACFYVMLKVKRTPLINHPIMGRLVSYRKMIQELMTIDEVLQHEVDAVLRCISRGGDVERVLLAFGNKTQAKASPKKQLGILRQKRKTASQTKASSEEEEDDEGEEDSLPKEKRVSFAADWKKRKGAETPVLLGDKKRVKSKATQELAYDDDTDDSDEYEDDEESFAPPKRAMITASSDVGTPSRKLLKVAQAPTLPEVAPTSAAELKAMADEIDQARKLAGEKWKATMKNRSAGKGVPVAEETKEEEETPPIEEDEEKANSAKRPINFQISKNKGLTPYHKKEERNPRVKYRNKFKKATSRRKGQVREVKREDKRYGGETSGIRAGTSRSVKFK